MSVYAVAQGRIEDHDLLQRYLDKAVVSVEPFGGRILAFDENPIVIEGRIDYPRTVIVEFPSMGDFEAWYHSPEYQAILPMRLKAVPGSLIVASGKYEERNATVR